MSTTDKKLITAEEVDANLAVRTVQTLDGRELQVTLKFPDWKERRRLGAQYFEEYEISIFLEACLEDASILNRLTPVAIRQLEDTALAGVLGERDTKAMLAALDAAIEAKTTSTNG